MSNSKQFKNVSEFTYFLDLPPHLESLKKRVSKLDMAIKLYRSWSLMVMRVFNIIKSKLYQPPEELIFQLRT